MIPILHEDSHLLVMDKPAGMPSVPLRAEETGTAVHEALAHFPELRNVGRGGLEPGILHRLDTATSGIIVFAKTSEAFELLKIRWKTESVRKWYRAVCSPRRTPTASHLTEPLPSRIDFPLGHSAKSSKKMIAIRHPGKLTQIRGKALPALTMVENVTLLDQETRRQDVTVEIKTGVMHQIRCHLSELNWPIDGDPIYHGAPAERLWLHAWRIELPIIGQTIGRPEKKEARLLLEARLPDHWPRS